MKRPIVVMLALVALAATTSAETLRMKSGRTLQVKSYRVEGDVYVVTMGSGRVRRIKREMVDESSTQAPTAASDTATATEPMPAKPSGPGAAKVFTNADLTHEESSTSATSQPETPPASATVDAEARKRDRQWETWRKRYESAQTRVDTAQARVDELESQGDALNGDVDTAGDGTKVGIPGGRGYYIQLEAARRQLQNAQTVLDKLRSDADAAGVPPGVMR